CEAEAFARMINLVGLAGMAPFFFVHVSTGLGLEYLKLARRQVQPVWVETCPQYLLIDEQWYYKENGVDYLLSPPLRS
ncbi:dihydropyrimidinase, partial [Aeromonas veronii]